MLSPISFDASTFELWGALLHGARCVIFPDRVPTMETLGEVLRRYQVSTLWLTASLFNAIVDEAPQILSGVRQLLTGGEALSPTHVRAALKCLPDVQLINGYGPTESTTFACCYRIPNSLEQTRLSIPIGRPIANTRVYILDRYGQPVPVGVTGELYLGGAGLARAYLNRPELTAERFVPDPFATEPGARMYRTGDLARYLADGNIEYLGRIDDQVKIRGYRIEPGEIETVLAEHPAVRQAVVLAREDTPGDKRLVAYVVPAEASVPSTEALRAHLRERLPDYMRPGAYVLLEHLPLTANGKIDRKALPVPEYGSDRAGDTYVPPRNSLEEVVTEVWQDVLKVERVGVHDNFFELGGHSLLATQVLARLAKLLKVELPLRGLFEAPTIAELASDLDRMSRGTDEAVLEQILREVAALTDVEAAHQLTALEVREIQNESE
jgi:acyl-coenzyme A synthetase/AMP-(fatty) acid ligase